jgi:3-oxoacyl-[acyl-carrier protein] reductase
MVDLAGKTAIVTGGSRGIGLAIASAFVARGVSVLVTGREAGHLAKAREVLDAVASGATARAGVETLVSDVREYADAERAVAAAGERFGGLDVLVNNAGIGAFADVADQSPDQWRQTLETNLTGVFNFCHAAIPALRRRGGGWIINVSSLAGKNPFPGGAAYCASKAGLNAFSEALMQELRYDDIRVSYVMPGSVRTPFGGSGDGPGSEWKLAPEDVAQVVVDLLAHDPRSLPSRVEIRPSKPKKR